MMDKKLLMWKDLSEIEKIERIREQMKQLFSQISRFNQTIQGVRNDLFVHDHKDGKVVKPISQYENSGLLSEIAYSEKLQKDEAEGNVYF